MGEFFPLVYFPEDYFPSGYFGEVESSGTTYADAAITVVGAGQATFDARGHVRAALTADGVGSAGFAPVVSEAQLPATPTGGASGGFGRVWLDASRRRFADAALDVTASGFAVFAPRAVVRAGLTVTGRGDATFTAEAVASDAAVEALQMQMDNEFWLLAA